MSSNSWHFAQTVPKESPKSAKLGILGAGVIIKVFSFDYMYDEHTVTLDLPTLGSEG